MPKFSKLSLQRLSTCDERLQLICNEIIKTYDISILCGHRGEAEQNRLFENGFSKVRFPNGKHNSFPSQAVDIAPWPIDWEDQERFTFAAGMFFAIAKANNIEIRWGGDWNRNMNFRDNSFRDLGHFELL